VAFVAVGVYPQQLESQEESNNFSMLRAIDHTRSTRSHVRIAG
jgi:hypothetical protein